MTTEPTDKKQAEKLQKEIDRRVAEKQGAPTYVDPGLGNGARQRPGYRDNTEYGRKLYDRIKDRK